MLDVRDWCAHHAGAPMTSVLHIGWNDLYFADNIFKCIFFHENGCILIQIILKCVPSFPTNNEMMRWYFFCHLYIIKFWAPYLCALALYVMISNFLHCTICSKVCLVHPESFVNFSLMKNESAEPFDINIKHGFHCGKHLIEPIDGDVLKKHGSNIHIDHRIYC